MGVVVKTEALIFIYLNSIFGGVLIGHTLLDTAQCDTSTSGELSVLFFIFRVQPSYAGPLSP